MRTPNVIVIGGGLAGLSASIALSQRGVRVDLVERAPRLGGRATSYILPGGEHVDNCQHVTLRCCSNLEDFYERIGAAGKIRYYDRLVFANSRGERGTITPSGLPAPLHLLPSFLFFRLLKWKDKQAIGRAMLHIVRSRGRSMLPDGTTMLDWLRQQKQTQAAVDYFWRAVLVSALNEDLERIDAGYGVAVFWKAFLSNPDGFRIGIPSVPLSELYGSSAECIQSSHGTVRTHCGVAELCMRGDQINAVRLDDGTEVSADYYVAALPFDRLLKLLPEAVRTQEPFRNLQNLSVSPITSVHLWFERPVMEEPFITSLDQTIQWVFNKTSGQYLQIVISASRNLRDKSQQEILQLCRDELAQLIPATLGTKILRSVVIRENAATFSPEPGCDRWRPAQHTPIQNFLIAGDWTRTGWPATMESAVRSGYLAAEVIMAQEGNPVSIVQPELRPGRLVSFLSRARRRIN
jgi:squalene-associated FAD-dependent desaturase